MKDEKKVNAAEEVKTEGKGVELTDEELAQVNAAGTEYHGLPPKNSDEKVFVVF